MKKLLFFGLGLFAIAAQAQSTYLDCRIKEVTTATKGLAGQETDYSTLNIVIEKGYLDITTDGIFSIYAPVNTESARYTAISTPRPNADIKIKMNIEINRMTGKFFGTANTIHPNGNTYYITGTGDCNKVSPLQKF